jgi:hypothetical protein
MADTITWGIVNLERHVADGVVYISHYTVTAERVTATGEHLTAGSYGSVGFSQPDPKDFIPYADLEEPTVVGWTQDALGGAEKVAEIEAALSANLDKQENPADASGLPWA